MYVPSCSGFGSTCSSIKLAGRAVWRKNNFEMRELSKRCAVRWTRPVDLGHVLLAHTASPRTLSKITHSPWPSGHWWFIAAIWHLWSGLPHRPTEKDPIECTLYSKSVHSCFLINKGYQPPTLSKSFGNVRFISIMPSKRTSNFGPHEANRTMEQREDRWAKTAPFPWASSTYQDAAYPSRQPTWLGLVLACDRQLPSRIWHRQAEGRRPLRRRRHPRSRDHPSEEDL